MEDTNGEGVAEKKKGRGPSSFVIFALVVLLVAMTTLAGYFYHKYRAANMTKSDQQEIEDLVGIIGKLMDVPTDEVPTVATITDKTKLAEQPFFKKADNGDKIVIYTKAGRAILYRPSVKKIIDVTTINTQNDTAGTPSDDQKTSSPEAASTDQSSEIAKSSDQESSQQVEPVNVSLLNGSTKIGVTQATEENLTAAFPEGVTVVAKEKAAKSDYKGILVVDVTSKSPQKTNEIAKTLGGSIVSMPEGEAAPQDTDILVIIGNSEV